MKFLAVKNFEKFQHYRDRAPTWIKLYRSLLDDYAFMGLPEAARSQLMLLWILASVYENLIPNDVAFLKRRLGVKSRLHLDTLTEAGFLYLTERHASTDASESVAKPYQPASPRALAERREETEGYKAETETETEQTPLRTTRAKPDVEIAVDSPPPDPSPRAAIDRFLTAAPEGKRVALRAKIETWRSGHDVPPGQKPSSDVLVAALDEYAIESTAGGFSFSPHHVWTFIASVARRYAETPANGRPPPASPRRSNTAVDRTVEHSRAIAIRHPDPV